MVASTPTDPEPWEDIAFVDDHDVDLNDLSPIPAPDRQRIYSHGFTVRVNLGVADSEPYMQKIGWSPEVATWIHSKLKYGQRSLIKGSTYVT